MAEQYDFVVIGSGISGAVAAERLAKSGVHSVLVLDQASHVGGLCRTQWDEDHGLIVPIYGTRVIYTANSTVADYLESIAPFRKFEHRLRAMVGTETYAIPINLETINRVYEANFDSRAARAQLQIEAAEHEARNGSMQDAAISSMGTRLYETFVRGFATKQLGEDPSKLSDELFKSRFPVRFDAEDRFAPFADWQALPVHGFHGLFDRLLGAENITVRMGVARDAIRSAIGICRKAVVYTGEIDAFFDFSEGPLDFRDNVVIWAPVKTSEAQKVAVLAHPDIDVPYFRTHAPMHLPYNHNAPASHMTLVGYELSGTTTVPETLRNGVAYPYRFLAKTRANIDRLRRYQKLARAEEGILFLGRHSIPSPNIEQSIALSLDAVERIKERFE
ncbi:MAG: UDP-galactopyranose mutase [Rhodobacter sp.]|nr:UDP-galactopyranose mutase [Rhodobacter sp.]